MHSQEYYSLRNASNGTIFDANVNDSLSYGFVTEDK